MKSSGRTGALNKISIKARVTVWYTGFMLILLCITALVLLLVSSRISYREAESSLRDVVSETISRISFRHGEADTEDIDFYRDEVSVFIYDTSGYLIAPRINMGLQVDSLLQDQLMRRVDTAGGERLVYDVYAEKDGTAFWVRGVNSMAESARTYRTLNILLLVFMPFFVIISAMGGWRITNSAFKPIKDMAAAADRISSGSDLSERIYVSDAHDELSRLGNTMNAMLDRLKESFEQEKQFTSDVSHELRTPLAVIRSQCEFALSPEASSADREDALLSIYRQSERMSRMSEQLLMLTRADRGRLTIEKKRLDLSALCRDLCEDLAPAAESEGLKLYAYIDDNVIIKGDDTLITRAISNLLANAVKYNKKGGTVTLSLKQGPEKKACILEVKDTGIGIDKKDIGKIWNRFYRADSSRSTEGTGLGLSMVKSICDIHGAKISVDSLPGKGSTFRLVFPETYTL